MHIPTLEEILGTILECTGEYSTLHYQMQYRAAAFGRALDWLYTMRDDLKDRNATMKKESVVIMMDLGLLIARLNGAYMYHLRLMKSSE